MAMLTAGMVLTEFSTIIGSDNGSSPSRRLAIVWANAAIL